MAAKRIAKLEVIEAGSNPDIDTDFRNDIRDNVVEHVADLYGHDSVSNIITFGTLAAKGAFKTLCTIYEIPFSQANKISNLIPPPLEGKECTIADIFNPDSDRYNESAEFRAAVSGSEWKHIVEGARRIEHRVRGYGMHACGVIISGKQLEETIPTWQREGNYITQWTYPECESIGLIKYDFLGLKTIDILGNTVSYILKGNKVSPNLVELIHGDMDDPQVYELFSRGDTAGVFQFGSSLVRDFCKVMQPTEFEDLAATTAILRPGPMKMLSHMRYAGRKNQREKIEPIHPDFVGGPLDEILEKTYYLVTYQEQILKIAKEIGGMTLKEGDNLRKAMGKKKRDVMAKMKPKFINGGLQNGYSKEAMEKLWDTLAAFAEYGFNRAHSIAYAMIAYQCAYLKAHYPAEFMAAVIAQNIDDKDETRMFIQDAQKRGLKIGTIDINLSDVRVAPDYSGSGEYDILFGISGASAVSEETASIIVKEREENGPYKSVQDLINRCVPLGVNNRRIYENLAYAGAFDCFDTPRRGVVENLPHMLKEGKIKSSKGNSLFDMFNDDEDSMGEMNLSKHEEYSYVKKLQLEANSIGLYLTDNPLSRIGRGLGQGGVTPISKLIQSKSTVKTTIIGSLTDIEIKTKRGKSIRVNIDDNTGLLEAGISREVIKGMDRYIAQRKIEEFYQKYETDIGSDVSTNAINDEFEPQEELEKNGVYIMGVTYRPGYGDSTGGTRVEWIRPLNLANNGSLPIRIRKAAKNDTEGKKFKAIMMKYAEAVSDKFPGEYPIYASVFLPKDTHKPEGYSEYYENLVYEIKNTASRDERMKTVEKKVTKKDSSLFGSKDQSKEKNIIEKELRKLPEFTPNSVSTKTEQELAESLVYFDTGFTAAKNAEVEELLSNKFGAERIDFGLFTRSMLD